jgi:Arc/MetJ family transcription regulator
MTVHKRFKLTGNRSGAFLAADKPGTRITIYGLAQTADLCEILCGGSHMATNLSIDPKLIERALEVSGERTKKAAVTKALQEFIARRRQKRLLDLMGKLEWDSSYDYKAERTRD